MPTSEHQSSIRMHTLVNRHSTASASDSDSPRKSDSRSGVRDAHEPNMPVNAPKFAATEPVEDLLEPDGSRKDSISEQFRVTFAPNDATDPQNWHPLRKWQILIVTLLLQTWANCISATYASGLPYVSRDFHISPAAARVVQAIYLYGFACGPVLSAPLSEDLGRLPVLLVGATGMGLFQLHCALSPNYGSLLVARFLSGFFGAATFNSVGTVADLWVPEEQGWGVNSFALAAEMGVVVASTYSGFLVQRTHTWRWLFGVTGIVTAFLLILLLLTVPETNPGVLLSRRARHLRKATGDDRYFSDHERARAQRTRMDTIKEVAIRPAHMLLTEPIVSAFAAFDGYNYSIIYLCLEAVPMIYSEKHGFSLPYQSYAFLAMGVGFLLAYATYPVSQYFVRRAQRNSPQGEMQPESLLIWGLFVAPLFPLSILYVLPLFPNRVRCDGFSRSRDIFSLRQLVCLDNSALGPVDCVDASVGRLRLQLACDLHFCERLHGWRIRTLRRKRRRGAVTCP